MYNIRLNTQFPVKGVSFIEFGDVHCLAKFSLNSIV